MFFESLRKSELSPKQCFEAKALVNIKYSNIPVNVPTIIPAGVRERAATLRHVSLPDISEKHFKPRSKLTHYSIRRHDEQSDIKVVLKDHIKQDLVSQRPNEPKGSMYVGELWGDKYRNGIIKTAKLLKYFKSIEKAESEDLNERLVKIEKLYKSKCLYESSTTDASKVMEDFKVNGLNSLVLDTSSFFKSETNSDVRVLPKHFKTLKSSSSLNLTESCILQQDTSRASAFRTDSTNTTPIPGKTFYAPEKKKRIGVKGGDKSLVEKSFSIQTLSSSRKAADFAVKNNGHNRRAKDLLKSIVNPNHLEGDFSRTKKSRAKYLDF